MDDKETLNFKIGLSGSSTKKHPEFKIGINGKKFIHDKLKGQANETEFFEFDVEIDQVENTIEIELLNKSFGDTVIDSDGNILEDLLLNIETIEVDQIELGPLKWSMSKYYPDYPERYKSDIFKNGGTLPDSINACVNLGWNGKWTLSFTSPFYIWLLENI